MAALGTIDGIAGWWTKDTGGRSEAGHTITTRFHSPDGAEMGGMEFEVLELTQNRVHWKFHAGPAEWIGTDVVFEVSEQDSFAIVLFGHLNWAQEVEFKAHCSMKWAIFLLSLKQYVETGAGNPAPADFKIDNWN